MLNGALFLCLLAALPRMDDTTDAVVDWLFETAGMPEPGAGED